MNKKTKTLTCLINLCFFLYFLLLLTERALSVVLSIANGVALYGDGFSGYVYTLVFVSVAGFFAYLLLRCREYVKALFVPEDCLDFRDLCIAGGILLLSGMVHTEYTISGLQFASYGIWILGILFQVILNLERTTDKGHLWISFAYLVCFSMAIPVMYRSFIQHHVLFHIVEGIASAMLVGVFTWFLLVIFSGSDYIMNLVPIVVLLVFDIPIIVLRWSEEPNWFLFIFLCLTFALYLVDRIYRVLAKDRKLSQ